MISYKPKTLNKDPKSILILLITTSALVLELVEIFLLVGVSVCHVVFHTALIHLVIRMFTDQYQGMIFKKPFTG